ncbi:MAG TPA: sensor domain-containing diguanylate cyclase [Acidimicrobiales bacterium]|nr:sensor domain-containing diguanylate cyclase [Acidimicrobiales bacterium]
MRASESDVELVPLADRTGVLHAFRLAMVLTALGLVLMVPQFMWVSARSLMEVTAVYLLFVVSTEVARQVVQTRRLMLVGAALLADGIWICYVVTETGGPGSVLASLVVLHVVAATLLASYRTGLKIAVWHCLLFVIAYYAMSTGLLPEWKAPGFGGATPTDFAVLAALVTFLGFAMATAAFSAVNERELRRRRRELRYLSLMANELQEVHSAEQVVSVLSNAILDTFGFPRVAVVIGAEDSVSEVWVRDPAKEIHRSFDDPRSREAGHILRRAWEERRVQLVRRLGDDSPGLTSALANANNLMVVPMVADGRPVGALVVERGGGMASVITRTRVSALAEFAAHGALCLKNAWLLREVERLARVDELTGLSNRRCLEETLEREVARSGRSGEPLSVVMFDVDHFKKLNDAHGHQHGDAVLRLMGQLLLETVRQIDTAARYGGEEFALVLPNCSPTNAVALAERVRQDLALRTADPPVTVSAGVATLPVHAFTGEELVRAADEALYESKNTGRDRVTLADRQASPAASPAPRSDAAKVGAEHRYRRPDGSVHAGERTPGTRERALSRT